MTFPVPDGLWPEERMERLTAMWAEGLSCGEIAKALGVTRNAVIGKRHRMKLPKRQEASHRVNHMSYRPKREPKPPKEPKAPKQPRRGQAEKHRPPLFAAAPVDATHAKPWLERAFGECAYIIAGEGADSIACCGPAVDAVLRPYCIGHSAVMFVRSDKSEKHLRWLGRAA